MNTSYPRTTLIVEGVAQRSKPLDDSNSTTIPLYHHGKVAAEAIVDSCNYQGLSKHKWYIHQGYAYRSAYNPSTQRSTLVRMHRYLLGLKPGDTEHSDHINGNKVDNRMVNLRAISRSGNTQNNRTTGSSGYKGVCWCRECDRWRVTYYLFDHEASRTRKYYVGKFKDKSLAALASMLARNVHHPFSPESRMSLDDMLELIKAPDCDLKEMLDE